MADMNDLSTWLGGLFAPGASVGANPPVEPMMGTDPSAPAGAASNAAAQQVQQQQQQASLQLAQEAAQKAQQTSQNKPQPVMPGMSPFDVKLGHILEFGLPALAGFGAAMTTPRLAGPGAKVGAGLTAGAQTLAQMYQAQQMMAMRAQMAQQAAAHQQVMEELGLGKLQESLGKIHKVPLAAFAPLRAKYGDLILPDESIAAMDDGTASAYFQHWAEAEMKGTVPKGAPKVFADPQGNQHWVGADEPIPEGWKEVASPGAGIATVETEEPQHIDPGSKLPVTHVRAFPKSEGFTPPSGETIKSALPTPKSTKPMSPTMLAGLAKGSIAEAVNTVTTGAPLAGMPYVGTYGASNEARAEYARTDLANKLVNYGLSPEDAKRKADIYVTPAMIEAYSTGGEIPMPFDPDVTPGEPTLGPSTAAPAAPAAPAAAPTANMTPAAKAFIKKFSG